MKKELEIYLRSKVKPSEYNGYNFILEGINFGVIDITDGISLQYYYVGQNVLCEPTEIILDKNISLEEFVEKLNEIIKKIYS